MTPGPPPRRPRRAVHLHAMEPPGDAGGCSSRGWVWVVRSCKRATSLHRLQAEAGCGRDRSATSGALPQPAIGYLCTLVSTPMPPPPEGHWYHDPPPSPLRPPTKPARRVARLPTRRLRGTRVGAPVETQQSDWPTFRRLPRSKTTGAPAVHAAAAGPPQASVGAASCACLRGSAIETPRRLPATRDCRKVPAPLDAQADAGIAQEVERGLHTCVNAGLSRQFESACQQRFFLPPATTCWRGAAGPHHAIQAWCSALPWRHTHHTAALDGCCRSARALRRFRNTAGDRRLAQP